MTQLTATQQAGLEFKIARLRTGITPKTLAKRTGMSASNISGIEHGRHDTRIGTLEALAQAAGLELKIEFVAKGDKS